MPTPHSASSQQKLMPRSNTEPMTTNPNNLLRQSTTVSAKDIGFKKVLDKGGEVNEETIMQIEVENPSLQRQVYRSELASKRTLVTRRWQTALATGIVLVALAAAIGKSKYSKEILFYSQFYSKVVWLIG
jgi:hypothetical protein